MGSNRRLDFCTVSAIIGLAPLSSDALAQALDLAPEPQVRAMDEVGVDLRSGKLSVDMGALQIGLKDSPTMSYSILSTAGWPDQTITDGLMHRNCLAYASSPVLGCVYEAYSYRLNGASDMFNVSPRSYYAPTGYTEKRGIYIPGGVLQRDGTQWDFGEGGLTLNSGVNEYSLMGLISKITKPDGETLTYSYDKGTLRSIVSSTGYMLHLEDNQGPYYRAPNYTVMQPGRPRRVVLLNLAVDYCAPLAASCAASSHAWPSASFSYAASGITVTDSLNNVRQRLVTGPDKYKMVWPSGKWIEYELKAWQKIISSATTSGPIVCDPRSYTKKVATGTGVWNYQFVENESCRGGRSVISGASTNPHGAIIQWNNGFIDGLQRKTAYELNQYSNQFSTDELNIRKIIDPEGGVIEYATDERLNVVERKKFAKSGGSYITERAEYPSTCSVYTAKICNKPIGVFDGNGGQTSYTYDANHGGVLTKTLPPNRQGIRLKIAYSYEQRVARFKNASGQIVDGSPIWKLLSQRTCQTSASCGGTADEVVTSYEYDGNLLPTVIRRTDGTGAILDVVRQTYDAIGNLTSRDGPMAGSGDTTYYFYDAVRQLIGVIGPDPDDALALPRPAKRFIYNPDGMLSREDTGTATGITLAALNGMQVDQFRRSIYDVSTGWLIRTEVGQP